MRALEPVDELTEKHSVSLHSTVENSINYAFRKKILLPDCVAKDDTKFRTTFNLQTRPYQCCSGGKIKPGGSLVKARTYENNEIR